MVRPQNTFKVFAQLLREGNPINWPVLPPPHVIGGHDMRLIGEMRKLEGLSGEALENGLKKIQEERGWS